MEQGAESKEGGTIAVDFATLSITVKRDDVPKATAELDKLTAAGDRAEKSTNRLAGANTSAGVSSVAATRNMGFWAAIQAESAGHVGEHTLAIGRLERQLASATEKFLGINPVIGLVSSSLLKFGLGTVETVGILAGIAAIGYAYDKLTENARKLREEQDKLVESLNQGNYDASLGPSPQLVKEVQAQRDLVMQEASRQRLLQKFGAPTDDIDRTLAYDRAQLAQGEARLTKARMDASTPLDPVKVRSDFFQVQRKLEEDALQASKTYWERQTEILKSAREIVDRLYKSASDYRRDNPLSDIVTGLVKDVLPQNVAIPHVGLTDSMTELQKRFFALLQPFDAVGEASIKLAENLRAAKNKVSVGAQNWKPGNIGSGIESGVTGAVGDALSQFSPQAIAFNLASKAIGFAVDGLTQLGASLLGVGASATEARRAQRQLTDEYNAAVASFRHDDLAAMLAQNLATYEQLIKQTNDTLGNVSTLIHGGADAFNAYKKAIADLSEQAKRNAALATQQAQEQKQYAQEDLNVRNLRATGRGDEADRIAFQERQAREMQAAREKAMADGVLDLSERLYLQTLATTQNNELLAFLNGTLTDAVRNAPTGFYGIAAYAGAYATPRDYPTDSGTIGSDKTGWMGGGGRSKGSPGNFTLTFQPGALVVDKNGMMNVVLEKIDIAASGIGGAGSSRSAALDTMTRK